MPELIIESVPSGAEVQMDGETIGTTPLTIPIEISLEAFREECLSNGEVSCSWDVLKTRLEDLTASRVWWDLTEIERRSVAKMAIENTINKIIWYYKQGADSAWKILSSPCTYNGIIRFQKFGTPVGWHDCYWKHTLESMEYPYAPEHYYGLPTVLVNTVTHVMCGIQVVPGIGQLSNWVIFQYSDYDLHPSEERIIIQDPFPYTGTLYTCIGFQSNVITEFTN